MKLANGLLFSLLICSCTALGMSSAVQNKATESHAERLGVLLDKEQESVGGVYNAQ